MNTPSPRLPTPFKELDFFAEADASVFCGRERETRQLVSLIVNSRAVVVHARSGLGKTSLLRAGVIPLLRQQNLRPVYVRTLDSLFGDLADAVVHDCGIRASAEGGDDELRACQAISAAAAAGPIVLVLDQFEEFFTRFERRTQERRAFVRFISDIVRQKDRDVRVVFSLREDYLYALDEFQRALPDLFSNALRLLPLTPIGAREAIVRPLRADNVRYDDALITQLIDELTEFDFDSARLQVTCTEVYRFAFAGAGRTDGLKTSDLNGLKESSGVGLRGIYRRYLREAISHIAPALHLQAKLLLDTLIGAKHTKFAVDRATLDASIADATGLAAALAALEEQKLVRREFRAGKDWFELCHECLIEEILEWFKDDDTFASFRFVRGLIEENSRSSRFRTHDEMLLTAAQLTAVTALADLLTPTPVQLEYVVRSGVYNRAPEVKAWAARQPTAEWNALVRDLLASPRHEKRVSAVTAMAIVGTAPGDALAACVELAFDDGTPLDLRAAAQKAVVAIGSEQDLEPFFRQARWGRTPREVRELLADLYEAGRMRERIQGLQRWQTVRRISVRRSKLYQDQRAAFVGRGLVGGVFGAAGATVVGILAVFLDMQTNQLDDLLLSLLGIVLGGVVLGLVIGARNGSAAFRSCAMGIVEWWRVARPRWPDSGGAAVGLILLNYLSVLWLAERVVATGVVAIAQPILRPAVGLRARLYRTSALCLVPALPLIFVLYAALHFGNESLQLIAVALMLLLCVANIELCSLAVAIPEGGIEGARPLDV